MAHPGFYFCNVVGEGGNDGRSDGFGNVKLGVIAVAVKVESMATDDVTKWEHVESEEDGAKN